MGRITDGCIPILSKHLTAKVAATQTFVRGARTLYDAALATALFL
ncbi:hypothetical protein [Microcoleus sp. FACHB-831]|nr:hypothetical protein [Microcoleus sp. FACHB-831]